MRLFFRGVLSPLIPVKRSRNTSAYQRHVSGAERENFRSPLTWVFRSPRSTAQSHTRPLRSIPLPAHLQFIPLWLKIAPRLLKFKIPLHCLTPAVLTEALRLGHTACVAAWGGFVA